MPEKIDRIGFGQVEPNHLSAQRTGQIYAQLPCDSSINILENGQFAKYNYKENKVSFDGDGEMMLVFNEVKFYENRKHYKDYALIKSDYLGDVMVPRLFKTNVGDIFTTNCFDTAATSADGETKGVSELNIGDKVAPDAETGYLKKDGADTAEMQWQVVKIYTMPDGQKGVKLQRIK